MLGQKYKKDIRDHGWNICHAKYGTWLLTLETDDSGRELMPIVNHVDGRRYLTEEILQFKYHEAREEWAQREKLRRSTTLSEVDDVDASALWI